MIILDMKNPSAPIVIITGMDTKPNVSTAAMTLWRLRCHTKVVQKRQKDISDIGSKIISMYAKGMTTRQISETMEDIYGFDVSEGFISDVTDKLLPQIEDWKNRPWAEIYPIVYIEAIHKGITFHPCRR